MGKGNGWGRLKKTQWGEGVIQPDVRVSCLIWGKLKFTQKYNKQENKQPGSLHEPTSHKLVILITMGKQLRESSGLIPLPSAPRLCLRMDLSAWGIPLHLYWVGES